MLDCFACFLHCFSSLIKFTLWKRGKTLEAKVCFTGKRQVEDKGRGSSQEGPQCPARSHQHLLVSCDHGLNSGALALSSPPLQRSACPSLPRILPVLTPGELKEFVHLFTMLVKQGPQGRGRTAPSMSSSISSTVGYAPGQQLLPKHRVRLLP